MKRKAKKSSGHYPRFIIIFLIILVIVTLGFIVIKISGYAIRSFNPNPNLYTCTPNWQCTDWSHCRYTEKTRTCTDLNNCGTTNGEPYWSQTCTPSCVSNCIGKPCGADDGCGNTCPRGYCPVNQQCGYCSGPGESCFNPIDSQAKCIQIINSIDNSLALVNCLAPLPKATLLKSMSTDPQTLKYNLPAIADANTAQWMQVYTGLPFPNAWPYETVPEWSDFGNHEVFRPDILFYLSPPETQYMYKSCQMFSVFQRVAITGYIENQNWPGGGYWITPLGNISFAALSGPWPWQLSDPATYHRPHQVWSCLPLDLTLNPSNYAKNVPLDKIISITFSKDMDPQSINSSTIIVKKKSSTIAGIVIYSGNTATFTPIVAFSPNTTYNVTLTTKVKDIEGSQLAVNYTWIFTTTISQPNQGRSPTIIITSSAGQGGMIIPSGTIMMSLGTNKSFTMTANTGYSIKDVFIDGISLGAINNYNFTNIIKSHTIQATFIKK